MSKKTLIGIAAGVLAAAGIFFLFKDDMGTPGENGANALPAMEFSETELHETENGKETWRLKVGHVIMAADKNTAELTDVSGYFKNDTIELTLTAKRGEAKREEKKLYLEGEVEGKTTDGAVLHAENLTYDGKTGILSTDKAFTIEKDGRILSADSFKADRILQKLEARGNARLREKGETN